MDDKLNLTLSERKNGSGRSPKTVVTLLCVLVLLGVANLLVLLYGVQNGESSRQAGGMFPETLKEMALRLEKRDISDVAVQTWKEYLAQADPEPQERAKIWYRIGKIFQEDGMYEQALAALYRSEGLAKIPELEPEINLRIQESLNALGKFAALRYELADRVGMDKENNSVGDQVLAEIGSHKITGSELDQRIEDLIEGQLAPLAAFLSEEEKKSQKESLLKRFSTNSERQRLLNQLVVEEMLYRKAVEDRLKEDAAVRMMVQQAERSILARQVLARQLADTINITQGDLQTYYEAHKQEYVDPERAKISHILVKDQKTAATVFKKLKQVAFEDLVEDYSLDEATKDKKGEINSWVRQGSPIPGIGASEDISRIIFSTDAGNIAHEAVSSDRGFHVIKVREKRDKRQQTFAEAREGVFRSLRSQKKNEMQQALLEQLKERYNVVVHMSAFQEEVGEANQ